MLIWGDLEIVINFNTNQYKLYWYRLVLKLVFRSFEFSRINNLPYGKGGENERKCYFE